MTNTFAVWFRTDFRFYDQPALFYGLKAAKELDGKLMLIYHLDPGFTDHIDLHHDYFFQTLHHFYKQCEKRGLHLHIIYGELEEALNKLVHAQPNLKGVFYNRDIAGEGKKRDDVATRWFHNKGIDTYDFNGTHIHEPKDVLKKDGSYYKVFTPYFRTWSTKHVPLPLSSNFHELKLYHLESDPIDREGEHFFFHHILTKSTFTWEGIGEESAQERHKQFVEERLITYRDDRDTPYKDGSSRLSPYIKTGNLSVRSIYHTVMNRLDEAGAGAESFLKELAWRDFYYMIHYFQPEAKDVELNEKYRTIPWNRNLDFFSLWKEGKTGFPLVDAGMRQLNQTGWMHNRLRMVTASFLTKDYLIDWRLGERYFQEKLIDYDASSNIGGWQWAASVGTDAVPYFRVFHPVKQSVRFDPNGRFIKAFVPELKHVPEKYIHEPHKMTEDFQKEAGCMIGVDYPAPTVDHRIQRKRAIQLFKGDEEN
ncbi:DNA photolyase family protein [Bacillus shivajii]|uniref:cryptochrome/photolyase family protein n=1 Tax=Bacillus shivajii TaxID=1983719 RepID=UPI001CF9DDBC|nr:deoxyribodipyrimidine photo-lyase [Bacillus shivajii]UCZ54040.1 DNA photolyase family protein [Bacillus shivajii]